MVICFLVVIFDFVVIFIFIGGVGGGEGVIFDIKLVSEGDIFFSDFVGEGDDEVFEGGFQIESGVGEVSFGINLIGDGDIDFMGEGDVDIFFRGFIGDCEGFFCCYIGIGDVILGIIFIGDGDIFFWGFIGDGDVFFGC